MLGWLLALGVIGECSRAEWNRRREERVRVADGDMCVIDPFRFASLLLLVPSSMVTLFPRFAAGCSHPFFLPSLPSLSSIALSLLSFARRVCGPP